MQSPLFGIARLRAFVAGTGLLWLALLARPAGIGFEAALQGGFYPFLLGDVFKIFLGAAILPGLWKLIGQRT